MTLIDNTLFGEIDKVEIAIERIKKLEPPEGYYLAFSGGKDSQVIYALAKMSGVKFDAHFNVTTVDPPELLKFIRDNYPEVKWEKPEKTMWQLISGHPMPPTRRVRYCCEWLKERGGADRVVMTGIRRKEGSRRASRRMVEICYRNKFKKYLNPIIDWRKGEVWEFIKKQGLKYCCLYDEGFHRIGCVGCPQAGKERLIHFERWPKYKKAYLRAFDKMLARRQRRGLPTTWQTPEEVMAWWLNDRQHKRNLDQAVLFE